MGRNHVTQMTSDFIWQFYTMHGNCAGGAAILHTLKMSAGVVPHSKIGCAVGRWIHPAKIFLVMPSGITVQFKNC